MAAIVVAPSWVRSSAAVTNGVEFGVAEEVLGELVVVVEIWRRLLAVSAALASVSFLWW